MSVFGRCLIAAVLLAATPALGQTRSPYGTRAGALSHPSVGAPRPAAGPYDRPTLGDPQPRVYGKPPSLGDPRPYRNTNPRTCTGLLCD